MANTKSEFPSILSTKKRVGKIISARRKELGLEQKELALYSQVSESILSNLENGKSNTTINTLEKILEVLGMELAVEIKKKQG